MCDWQNPNNHDIETCFAGPVSSCDIKRTRKSKGAHGCAGKKFNGGFCKVRELWQTEEQIWRKRSSSVSTASSILTTKPKHIFIAISQIIFNWKIHAEWRQIRRNKKQCFILGFGTKRAKLSNMKQSNNCQRTVKEITTFRSQLVLVNKGNCYIWFSPSFIT